MDLDWILIL